MTSTKKISFEDSCQKPHFLSTCSWWKALWSTQSSVSSLSCPLSRNHRRLPSFPSFQLHLSIHSWHPSVRRALNSWEAHPGDGEKSFPEGSCSLLTSVSQHLSTTPPRIQMPCRTWTYHALCVRLFSQLKKRKTKKKKKGKEKSTRILRSMSSDP